MTTHWHKRAAAQLHQVEDYVLHKFGERTRRLNKLVYYVKDDTLHIAAFWDTRREPKNQAKKTK